MTWDTHQTVADTKEFIEFVLKQYFLENIGSRRVMVKIGMSYEGTLKKELFIKGKHRDVNMFSILKEEFEALSLAKKEHSTRFSAA